MMLTCQSLPRCPCRGRPDGQRDAAERKCGPRPRGVSAATRSRRASDRRSACAFARGTLCALRRRRRFALVHAGSRRSLVDERSHIKPRTAFYALQAAFLPQAPSMFVRHWFYFGWNGGQGDAALAEGTWLSQPLRLTKARSYSPVPCMHHSCLRYSCFLSQPVNYGDRLSSR